MIYEQANEIALQVLEKLAPVCKTVHIAGSIRRLKPEVKDIEICAIAMRQERMDLFGTLLGDGRSPEFLEAVKGLGIALKGNPAEGRNCQIQLPEGIVLDLFLPQEEDYYRQFAIRTGSANYAHKVLATGWLNIGWCGTRNDGLRLKSECYRKLSANLEKVEWICNTEDPTKPPVWKSEQELFDWLKIEWVEPQLRNL